MLNNSRSFGLGLGTAMVLSLLTSIEAQAYSFRTTINISTPLDSRFLANNISKIEIDWETDKTSGWVDASNDMTSLSYKVLNRNDGVVFRTQVEGSDDNNILATGNWTDSNVHLSNFQVNIDPSALGGDVRIGLTGYIDSFWPNWDVGQRRLGISWLGINTGNPDNTAPLRVRTETRLSQRIADFEAWEVYHDIDQFLCSDDCPPDDNAIGNGRKFFNISTVLLPDESDDGTFTFEGVPSGVWFDPPTSSGFEYKMTSDSLFTKILDFPIGFADPFSVLVDGVELGQFNPGEMVDFVSLLGEGVSEFSIEGINPLVDPSDPTVFPLKLEFDTPTASFQMKAISTPVPEPLTILGAGTAIAFGTSFKRKLAKAKKK